jgi:hypothetical protein
MEKAKRMLDEFNAQLITQNEYRVAMGYDPDPDGDEFKSSPVPMNLFGQTKEDDGKSDSKEDLDERRKSVVLKGFADDSDGIETEARSYDEFLSMKISLWEDRVLRAMEIESVHQKKASYVKKTFGGFLSRLFNTVNTKGFTRQVQHFVKQSMKAGLEDAESELKLDIGVSERFQKQSEFFANQQLEGYRLPDGKKWHGIKGATHDLQLKILKEVRDGVVAKEDLKQIQSRVKGVFKIAKDSQAERIARTETNRFVNEGKLTGYVDSGLEGGKVWQAFFDDRTSDLCKRFE